MQIDNRPTHDNKLGYNTREVGKLQYRLISYRAVDKLNNKFLFCDFFFTSRHASHKL